MDAHYHIVMEAREAITDTQDRYYFAYSSALDRESFLKWRNQHSYTFFDLPEGRVGEVRGMELSFNCRSRWWRGRVAGLEPHAEKSVFGLLFKIPAKDWPVVQHKEGFITKMCVEIPVEVDVGGEKIQATAFTTSEDRKTQDGEISSRYIQALVLGARASQLPEEYVQHLETLAPAEL